MSSQGSASGSQDIAGQSQTSRTTLLSRSSHSLAQNPHASDDLRSGTHLSNPAKPVGHTGQRGAPPPTPVSDIPKKHSRHAESVPSRGGPPPTPASESINKRGGPTGTSPGKAAGKGADERHDDEEKVKEANGFHSPIQKCNDSLDLLRFFNRANSSHAPSVWRDSGKKTKSSQPMKGFANNSNNSNINNNISNNDNNTEG